MRRNRTKTRRTSKNQYLTIIAFVVLLFVGAPTIGYFGTKYFLIPKFFTKQDNSSVGTVTNKDALKQPQKNTEKESTASSNSDKKTDTSKEEPSEKKLFTFEIPSLSIYSIQVGSFDDRNHAQIQIKNLNDKGLGGYIIESDRFRVVAMSFVERSSAEKFRDNIKNHYSDAFISAKQLPVRSIDYGDKGKAYSEVAAKEIKELKKHYESFSGFLANNDISSTDTNEIIQFIDSEINRLDKIAKSMTAVSPSEDFTNFNNKFTNIIKTSKAKLIEVKESNLSNKTKLFEILMESINSYVGII